MSTLLQNEGGKLEEKVKQNSGSKAEGNQPKQSRNGTGGATVELAPLGIMCDPGASREAMVHLGGLAGRRTSGDEAPCNPHGTERHNSS